MYSKVFPSPVLFATKPVSRLGRKAYAWLFLTTSPDFLAKDYSNNA